MNSNIAVRGVKWTTFSSVVSVVSALISVSILTRYVDKSEFGLIAIVVFSLSFFELFNDMGISIAILHKQKISQNEYSSLYFFNILVSAFIYIIVLFTSPLISWFYHMPELSYLIPLVGLNICINGIGRQFKVIQEKELRFKNISIVEISTTIVALCVSVYLAINNYGVLALVANSLCMAFLSNILFLIISLSCGHKITAHFKIEDIKPFLKIGMYQMGGQVANYFNRDFDILIVGKTMGPEILGIYSLAKQLVLRPFQVLNPIILKVATPLLVKFQNTPKDLKNNYLKFVNVIGSINLLAYTIVFIFSPLIIEILYGNSFQDAIWIVRILCFYMVIRSVGNPIGSLSVATGKTYLEFNWNLAMLIIMPVSIYLGSLGNIYTICISLVAVTLLSIYPFWKYLVRKMIDVTFIEYIKKCFIIDFSLLKTFKK